MYLKCESFQVASGSTLEATPLITADIKANAVLLVGNTSCTIYIGGSAMTSDGGGGFPLPSVIVAGSSLTYTNPTPLLLKGEDFGWANAEISLNTIYTRSCNPDTLIKVLYFRRVDEDD